MLNWWLILLIILIPIIAILGSVYVLLYFQSEEDGVGEYFPKAVFCLSMIIAFGSVLLVPFDAANSPNPAFSNAYYDTLDTQLMWTIIIWIMGIFAIIICPFVLFYYENYDPDKPSRRKQLISGITITAGVFIVFLVLSLVCYSQWGEATIPFRAFIANPQEVTYDGSVSYTGKYTTENFVVTVEYEVYCFALLCLVGWIALAIYGGIGVGSYPISALREFINRPKRMSSTEFAEEMSRILQKSEVLLDLCEEMKGRSRGSIASADATRINILRNEVFELEEYQKKLIYAFTTLGGSPFLIYGKLLLACCSVILGFVWILHIFLYTTFDLTPFLNTLLVDLGNVFPLLGTLAFSVLTFYLMWATFNGQMALGLRLVFFQIYPMRKHDTLLNALLFNSFLMLLTSFALIQFVSRSFRDYAPLSSINGLMNVYILRLKGIGYIIQWAQFALIGIAILSLLWLALCPKKKRKAGAQPAVQEKNPGLLDLDVVL